jgi:hypothetical protein
MWGKRLPKKARYRGKTFCVGNSKEALVDM